MEKNNKITNPAANPHANQRNIKLPFAAYKGSEPYLFISYSHKDTTEVFSIIGKFHDQEYNVWYDEGIEPGIEWPEEIGKALNDASLFVVFISPDSVESENVRNEINFALKKKKPFMAIYLRETELTYGLQLQIGSKQDIKKYLLDEDSFQRKYLYSFESVFKKQNPVIYPSKPKPEQVKQETVSQPPAIPIPTPAGALKFTCDIVRRAACEKIGLSEDRQLEMKHTNAVSELRIFAEAYGEQFLACSKGKERLMVYKKESQPVFFFERGSVSELSDFLYFKNLEYLSLIFQSFSDLSPLANLPIKVLDLSCNQLSDLSPLGKMGKLTNLSLDYATYGSLTPLGDIKTLSFLSVYELSYKGFTELCSCNLPNLQTLHIPFSKLESLEGISNLPYLSWLSINDCIIFDFEEIAKLKNLTTLSITRTKCSDFSFLKELPLLKSVIADEEQKTQIIELYGEKPSFLK